MWYDLNSAFALELGSTKICGPADIDCTKSAFRFQHLSEVSLDLEMVSDPTSCNCLPACMSITYDAEISQTDSYMEGYYEALNEKSQSREG
jgi:Amiloride-sensitive sodium channel